MAVQIQLRNDIAANWTSANPTLAAGELGVETDTGSVKVGDGTTAWTSLGYFGIGSGYVDNAIAALVDTAPGALDTLNELAASLGDDADFAGTVTTSLATKAPLNQTITSQNTNYSIQASDSGSVIKVDGTVTITLSDNVLPAGARVDIINVGSGTVTIAGGGTMTVNSKDAALTIATQYAAASLIADSATTSYLIGDIA